MFFVVLRFFFYFNFVLKQFLLLYIRYSFSFKFYMVLCWFYFVFGEYISLVQMDSDRDQVVCRSVSWKIRGGEGIGSFRDRCCYLYSVGV